VVTPISGPLLISVLGPADAVPASPPVTTRPQVLPFGELTWENFERLCHRLTALEGDVDHCARYGRQGDEQEGIDIFARLKNGRYHCLQAKRHRTFGPTKLRKAVGLFLSGEWAAKAERFTIAVQASLSSIKTQKEIEHQAARLNERGIVFQAIDGETLTERLRGHPQLVDDFFGRPWVVTFFDPAIADGLAKRLDGAAFASVRARLAKSYQIQFHSVDPGSFASVADGAAPELTLVERFAKPDILVRDVSRFVDLEGPANTTSEEAKSETDASQPLGTRKAGNRARDAIAASRPRRTSLGEWFGDGQRLAVIGEAGCGKSTLLRVVALDLLGEQTLMPELAQKWGLHIPVYVPFALWCSLVSREQSPIGLKEIVRRWLQPLLSESIVDLLERAIDERRVLLLVDGLDEWADAQAARTTLATLLTTIEAHDLPVIVSGRPLGLDRIGTIPSTWKRGIIAPLSVEQQTTIAERWFGRHVPNDGGPPELSVSSQRTRHFMAALAREGTLRSLATIPLLLVGLVTLYLRGQILPRTRVQIYGQLVRVLLEVHPALRATASGSATGRFKFASDEQRRLAIAKLAFALRDQQAGGMMRPDAKDTLYSYFASSSGAALSTADATAAAEELLAVNAETQGLIVEKASAEVGFVHASFEEFLAAQHIETWPLADIESFVRDHASEPRWRNVIANVLELLPRANELNALVEVIEEFDGDELARFNRQALLGDIAIGAAHRAPATAQRLALDTVERVGRGDWLPARRQALTSVLRGLADPALRAELEDRLRRWLPARSAAARGSLIGVLSGWEQTARMQDLLFLAMSDEDAGVRRAAAAGYARAFSGSSEACQRLLVGLSKARSIVSAAALVESLALGWPRAPGVADLFEQARRSSDAQLCLVGILGLAEIGSLSDESRDIVLRAQNHWADVSHPYHDLAVAMLMKYWPNDSALVQSALGRLSGQAETPWEYEAACHYLLECSVDRSDVREWILSEFTREFPFNVMSDGRVWSRVGRFAAIDPKIRAAANAYWSDPGRRVLGLHRMRGYVTEVADSSVATALFEALEQPKRSFDRYWALTLLLEGWGRDHPDVKRAIDKLAGADDDELEDLVSLIPEIFADTVVARARLIRLGSRPTVRRDLLARGLEGCGCSGMDDDAVDAIFTVPDGAFGRFGASHVLYRAFSSHARVRALAWAHLQDCDAPLDAIAVGFAHDSEIASALLDLAVPLAAELRAQVIEVAAFGGAGTPLEALLAQGMLESDPEIRARMVTAHCRAAPSESRPALQQALLEKAQAVGPDHESMRAAALAGLAAIDALDALAPLVEGGKPILLETGGPLGNIPTVERLVCEHYAEFEKLFGDSLHERLRSHGAPHRLAEILSTAPNASPASRAAFLRLAERADFPRTPNAIRALAAEIPRSDLLLTLCLNTLQDRDHRNDRAAANAEVALVLRDQFPNNIDVRRRLLERWHQVRSMEAAIALAIYAPDAEELPLVVDLKLLDRTFADWTVAIHVAARRADSEEFCRISEAMATRRFHSQFDAQPITNLAIDERLQRDSEVRQLFVARINGASAPSVSGSFARYLAAAGALSVDAHASAVELLRELGTNQRLPVAGYDAVSHRWRAVRATLLDAISPGIDGA